MSSVLPVPSGFRLRSLLPRRQGATEVLELPNRSRKATLELEAVWKHLALRMLRSDVITPPWVVGVTSAVSGEGRTTSCIGLARAVAPEVEGTVILVETDVTAPSLARDFGTDPTPGLAEYLSGASTLQEALKRTSLDNLMILPAGGNQAVDSGGDDAADDERAAGAVGIDRVRRGLPQLLSSLRTHSPHILLDLQPIVGNPSTEEMVPYLDGVLIVVRAGATPLQKFREAVALCGATPLVAVVHMGLRSPLPRWLKRILE